MKIRIALLLTVSFAVACFAAPPLTKGTGYCVSIDGLGIVKVPFHKPDPANLEELRGSIHNAIALILNQAEVRARAAGEPTDRIDQLRGRLDKGVTFTEANKPVMKGGPIECTCATYYGAGVLPAYCGGACGDCWSCR